MSASTLEAIDDGVWTLPRAQSFLGLHLGTRMTIVRLSDGGLFVHSPVALDETLREAVAAIGPVRHIVAPNLYHHLYAGQWAAAYPEAVLHGHPRLADKRKDLALGAELGDAAHPGWAEDFDHARIQGSWLGETVFLHRKTGSLLVTDLVENFSQCDHWLTRTYLRASGVWRKPGVSRPLRLFYRDREAARTAVDRVLQWDFHRIVPCHGDVMDDDAKTILRDSFAWLSP